MTWFGSFRRDALSEWKRVRWDASLERERIGERESVASLEVVDCVSEESDLTSSKVSQLPWQIGTRGLACFTDQSDLDSERE